MEKGGKGMRRHLLLGRVHEELCDEVFCWCLWVTEVNILHFHPGGKSASILVNVKKPSPQLPFTATKEPMCRIQEK